MLKYFDMMYYYYATFYKRYYKKTSGWQMQAVFVVSVTQFVLLIDILMLLNSILDFKEKVSIYEKIVLCLIGLFFVFYNMKRYEKKYQYYKSIWGKYEGKQKNLYRFLTVFTTIFAWCFVFILAFIFDRYK
ncbi:MAG: hypothetical protein BGO86_01300 [Chryseobacterium sp. 36-9]|nr:MAG: hypothetical protein BGO86_01300 [Chryseobacterium sp. 36-9]